ncbi:o-succinylbenzoate--CoA ligase [Gordonia soli]|uniref:O-succinylbenzoate--CoA ligase n=1 Tax=Gordonia soli NBRC 108243 TaxID=1223545 RepID=M0QI47_9ACTN|nr:o-succinylbenzoate--CoA ligase [Gordonia soli]GAC67966.1 o-succinylbenzoate--CoA ligase [Gordonia soli NBRC 108243]
MLEQRGRLRRILDGESAVLPVEDARQTVSTTEAERALGVGEPIDDDISLVIATSGTTGVPKGAQHTPTSLAASARATARHLGGEGSWLLALAPHHIAGLQVLLRATAAGTDVEVLDLRDGFDPEALVAAADRLSGTRRYTSLVPTQLVKVLESPAAIRSVAGFDAVLIGGAATPRLLQERALDAGLPIVRTYGMSETAGGCVYDGVPLDGVSVRIANPTPDGVGRVLLGGPMVARGYRNRPDHEAFADLGWFRTDDLGRLDADGKLVIIGRADEAITTGGLTVVPQVVEAVLLDDPSVVDCAVVGLPDARLGEQVVAAVIPAVDTAVDTARLRGLVIERLDRYAAPRQIIEVSELPRRGPGKVDRRELRRLLTIEH